MTKQSSTDSPTLPDPETNPLPKPVWKEVGEAFQKGRTVSWIAKRYRLSVVAVQRQLDLYLLAQSDVRTPEEISAASVMVKSNLVTAMVKLSYLATTNPDPETVMKLVATSARLFAWPTPKAVDSLALAGAKDAAINLSLIATKPDQLKTLALQRAASLDMEPESDHDSRAGAKEPNKNSPENP